MRRFGRYTLIACLALLVTGCGGSKDSTSTTPSVATVNVFHAAADAPRVNLKRDNTVVTNNLDYMQVSQVTITGTQSISVDAVLPGGQTTQVIAPQSFSASASKLFNMFIVGKVSNGTLTTLALPASQPSTNQTSARIQFAHLAAKTSVIDIYVTAPGVSVNGLSPALSLAYKDIKNPLDFTAGNYEIQVTASGQKTVLYNSGPLSLTAGSNLVIGAVDNTHYGTSPISLIEENQGSVTQLPDINAGAGLRFAHNSYNTSALDGYLNSINGSPLINNLAFPNVYPGASLTSHTAVSAGSTNILATLAGQTTALVSNNFSLQNAHAYTVIAANAQSQIELYAFDDNSRSIATESQFRFINGAGQGPNVDVYLTPQGSGGIGNTSPIITNLAFGQSSAFLAVNQGSYDVYVATAGTGTAIMGPIAVTLTNGGIYTLLSREDVSYTTSNKTYNVTRLDGLAVP